MSSSKPRVINGKWSLGDKIGTGGFGKVYKGTDIETGEQVALKISQDENGDEGLQIENNVYEGLRNTETEIVGVPRLRYFGTERGHKFLVVDLLGQTMEQCLKAGGGTLSLKSVLMVGIQILRRLQLIHHKGYIHRDVTPGNMLVGRKDKHRVYLIDFGVSQKYRDYETRDPVSRNEAPSIVGSIPFISVNAHKAGEQYQSDDLESLGYSMVYLFKGKLPWQDIKLRLLPWQKPGTKADLRLYKKLGAVKAKTDLEELCEGMPHTMVEYFRYVQGLKPGKRPDYSKMRGLFREGLEENDEEEDRVFDWMKTSTTKGRSSSKPR